MKFALLADIHYQASAKTGILRKLEETIAELQDANLDRLILVGDLIHDSESKETDWSNLETVVDQVEAIDTTTQYLPGNHDVVNLSVEEFEAITGTSVISVDAKSEHVYLDSTTTAPPEARGELGDEQRTWLQSALHGLDAPFVFLHHPIHYQDLRSNPWFEEYPEEAFCTDKRLTHDILSDSGVVQAVFNAHLHEMAYVNYDDVMHFSIDSFNNEREAGTASGAYTIVDGCPSLRVKMVAGDGTETEIRLPPSGK